MEHDRYGLNGLPLACRSANSDPVTGLPLPALPATENKDDGLPFLAPIIACCMIAFAVFFIVESNLLG